MNFDPMAMFQVGQQIGKVNRSPIADMMDSVLSNFMFTQENRRKTAAEIAKEDREYKRQVKLDRLKTKGQLAVAGRNWAGRKAVKSMELQNKQQPFPTGTSLEDILALLQQIKDAGLESEMKFGSSSISTPKIGSGGGQLGDLKSLLYGGSEAPKGKAPKRKPQFVVEQTA